MDKEKIKDIACALGFAMIIIFMSIEAIYTIKNPTPAAQTTPTATAAYETSTGKGSSESKERVTCSVCNGTGSVKYYYGGSALEALLSGHNDYEYGTCTSCDGKGYTYVTVKNSSSGTSSSNKNSSSSGVTCPSCGKKVSSLTTKKDAAGVSRSWCSSCWKDYNSIMGR